MTYQYIHFCGTSGHAAATPPDTYSLGVVYPETREGLTFGWTSNMTGVADDRTSAGAHLVGYIGVVIDSRFRVDLPNGAGTYNIRLAFGQFATTVTPGFNIYDSDNSTVRATVSPTSVTAGQFMDATGVVRTSGSDWNTNNAPISLTFTGDHFFLGRTSSVNSYPVCIAIENASLPPANTVAPLVSGTTTQGQTLSTTNGSWSGSPTSYAYQWVRDVVDIVGATASTYVLVDLDAGANIKCRVTATNAAGSASANSNAVGPITALAPVNTALPLISGTAVEGAVLSISNGGWSNYPASYAYQWKRGGVSISGATAATRTLDVNDVGAVITCTVTATNSGGSTAGTSSGTASIANGVLAAFGLRTSSTAADSRWSYYVDADKQTLISRAPAVGPGTYSMAALGSLGTRDGDTTYGNPVVGYMSIGGSSGQFRITGLPLNTPIVVRAAIGAASTAAPSGARFYQNDPNSGGAQLFEAKNVSSVGAGQLMDATGAILTASQWSGLNQGVTVTLNTAGASGTGEIWIGRNVALNTCYLRAVMIHYPTYGAATSGTGPYFIDSVTPGLDTNNGTGTGAPWLHAPGDPGAGGFVPIFVPLPDAMINFKKAGRYRPASYGARTKHIYLSNAGTSGHPITYQANGSGASPIIDGSEVISSWSAASSGDMGANPNYANCQKTTLPAAVAWNQFATEGSNRLYPACWPVPGNIAGFDNSDAGSDAFNFEDVSTGPHGASAVFTEGANNSSRTDWKLCTYTGGKVLARYGSISISGYRINCRIVGNLIAEYDILSHNTATGGLTFEIPNGAALWTSTSAGFFEWQIRYHPFDLRAAGQYAYNSARTVLFGQFRLGERGIARLGDGVILDKSYLTFSGLDFCRFSNGLTGHAFNDNGNTVNGITLSNITISQCTDYGREGVIRGTGGGSGWTVSDITMVDNTTQGGLQFGNINASTFNRIYFRNGGRTALYFGGNCHGNVVTDFDASDNGAIHGNGATIGYETSYNNTLQNFIVTNHANPFTAQGSAKSAGHTVKNGVITARRTPAAAPTPVSAFAMRIDTYGMTDSLIEGVVVGLGGPYIGSDNVTGANNYGLVVRNTVFTKLNVGTLKLANIKFENVLILSDNGNVTAANIGTFGLDPASFGYAFASGAEWDGTISQAIQKTLTKDGAAGTYTTRSIALSGVAGRAWTVPGWGTAFALADCWLTTSTCRAGVQVDVDQGMVMGTQPGSSLSLPAAVDNARFTLTNGQWCWSISGGPPTAGTYTMRVRQTNSHPDLIGGGTQTKDTDFTITVI